MSSFELKKKEKEGKGRKRKEKKGTYGGEEVLPFRSLVNKRHLSTFFHVISICRFEKLE
jgi:hypothetical protein